MRWVDALKKYNEGKTTWCIPRKGTPEHTEVLDIMKGKKKEPPKIDKKTEPSKLVNEIKAAPEMPKEHINSESTVEEKRNAVIKWVKRYYMYDPETANMFQKEWTKTQIAKIKKWNGKINELRIEKQSTTGSKYLVINTKDNNRERILFFYRLKGTDY